MKHLTKEQVSQLQAKLEAKLAQLKQFKKSVDQANPVNDPERVNDNSEAGDEALEDHSILENGVLSEESQEIIQEVKAALQRIQDGKYGLDEESGEPIPFARLNLVPEARTLTSKQ
jgi:DnaK suppressor protein